MVRYIKDEVTALVYCGKLEFALGLAKKYGMVQKRIQLLNHLVI